VTEGAGPDHHNMCSVLLLLLPWLHLSAVALGCAVSLVGFTFCVLFIKQCNGKVINEFDASTIL
jgi:hypothetical protein